MGTRHPRHPREHPGLRGHVWLGFVAVPDDLYAVSATLNLLVLLDDGAARATEIRAKVTAGPSLDLVITKLADCFALETTEAGP